MFAGIGFFFIICHYENTYAQKIKYSERDSTKKLSMQDLTSSPENVNKQAEYNLELKVDYLEKYVTAGQKNLDMWLKILTCIFSILIGFSVFNGFRIGEKAKEEFASITKLGVEIKTLSDNAKEKLKKLKKVTELISQVEQDAEKTKKSEIEASKIINDLASKIELTTIQEDKLDALIEKSKIVLEKSGIDAFKNLYYAKALKAHNDKQWEDAVRLWNTYIDLDDQNAQAFALRAFDYSLIDKPDLNRQKVISDYTSAINLDAQHDIAFHNRALNYSTIGEKEKAIADFNEAIRLNPNKYPDYYTNRAELLNDLGKKTEATQDLAKAEELKSINHHKNSI